MLEDQSCRALVVTCIDFRFFHRVEGLLRAESLEGAADVIAWPGGGAALALEDGGVVLDAVGLSMRLHRPGEVILVAHDDCARLKSIGKGDSARDHEALLRHAGGAVATRFPHAKMRLVILRLDGSDRWLESDLIA